MSFLRNIITKSFLHQKSCRTFSFRLSSKSSSLDQEDEEDRPIKYTTSQALKYKAVSSLRNDLNARLWYEPYVILGSLTIFLVYFTMLREENDIDEALMTPLHNRIDGLEELQLQSFIESSNDMNEVSKAKQRLSEIKLQKESG